LCPLGTAFIEHRDDLWPQGDAPDADFIRAQVDDLMAMLEQMLRHDGLDVRRICFLQGAKCIGSSCSTL